jgi:hypothetical protein
LARRALLTTTMPKIRATINTYKKPNGCKFRAIIFRAMFHDEADYRTNFVAYLPGVPKDCIRVEWGEPGRAPASLTEINSAVMVDSIPIKEWYVVKVRHFQSSDKIDVNELNANVYTDETDWVEKWLDQLLKKGQLERQFVFNTKSSLLTMMLDLHISTLVTPMEVGCYAGNISG